MENREPRIWQTMIEQAGTSRQRPVPAFFIVRVLLDGGSLALLPPVHRPFLLVFHQLVEVRIEGIFRDITEDLHLRVLVALPDDSAQPLSKVRRTPRAIQIMQGNQFIQTVCACAHLGGTANQNSDLPRAHFGKPVFQRFPGALHLLNGIILRMIPFGLPDAVQDAVDLPPQNDLLPLLWIWSGISLSPQTSTCPAMCAGSCGW